MQCFAKPLEHSIFPPLPGTNLLKKFRCNKGLNPKLALVAPVILCLTWNKTVLDTLPLFVFLCNNN